MDVPTSALQSEQLHPNSSILAHLLNWQQLVSEPETPETKFLTSFQCMALLDCLFLCSPPITKQVSHI